MQLDDAADDDTAARGISDAAFPPRRHVFIMALKSGDVVVLLWTLRIELKWRTSERERERERERSEKK